MNSLGRDGRTLILKGLGSPFKNVRLWACRKVAVNHITVGVPGLISLLNSKDPEVSVQAAVALEEISLLGPSVPGVSYSDSAHSSVSYSAHSSASSVNPGPYSSRKIEQPLMRSVFPLSADGRELSRGWFQYYVRDLTPLKFIGASIALFLLFYCLREAGGGPTDPKSSIVFEDFRPVDSVGSKDYQNAGNREDVNSYLVKKKLRSPVMVKDSSPVMVDNSEKSHLVSNAPPEQAEVWLAVALRYLEAGRPLECIKYCDRLIAQNRKTEEAKALKRLARERYGMIN
jgi:hypothetical protein